MESPCDGRQNEMGTDIRLFENYTEEALKSIERAQIQSSMPVDDLFGNELSILQTTTAR